MPYILGPSDYWIWDGMDPGTPLDMAYIGYPGRADIPDIA